MRRIFAEVSGMAGWVWRTGLGMVLAGGGAVVAWWLGGHQVVWLGGVVGAVSGAYAPPLTDWAKGRAEARKAARGIGELPGSSPAGLLDPRRGVVGFTGREIEPAGLVAWCRDGTPRGVRLVTGPGGVGKTRLSVELCARLEPLGWRCVRVGDGAEASALGVLRGERPGRVLLVVDYAETRVGLAGLLRSVAADAGPVRVLLLARSAGEWWDRLRSGEPAVRELAAAARPGERLPVSVSASDEQVVMAAVPAFAAALGIAVPSGVVVKPAAGAARMLDLHAAALVAVLRSAGTGAPVQVQVQDVLAELLGHEERFWLGSAERLGLLAGTGGLTPAMVRQVVAAGALLGAGSEDEAAALLGRVPGVAPSVRVARWLRDLYPPQVGPPGGGEWVGSLSPDRLAEHLVVTELTGSPEHGRAVLERAG